MEREAGENGIGQMAVVKHQVKHIAVLGQNGKSLLQIAARLTWKECIVAECCWHFFPAKKYVTRDKNDIKTTAAAVAAAAENNINVKSNEKKKN